MTSQQDQLVALGGVFSAAIQVDKLAKTGQFSEPVIECLLKSLLVVNPENTLAVYGGSDNELWDGYKALSLFLNRDQNASRDALRYAISLLMLERKLNSVPKMLATISEQLPLLQNKVEHFGLLHDNVFATCGSLYEETISTFSKRIQVVGDINYLQQPGTAAQIRTILMTGIRSAMLWHQVGGRRWHLLFKRSKLLNGLNHRLQN